MKTLRAVVALAALSVAPAASAQTVALAQPVPCGSTPRSNVVLADLGLHVIGVGYQRRLSCRFAVQGSLDFYDPWMVTNNVLGTNGDFPADTTMTGFGLRLRGFYYPFGAAPTGLWVSPFVQAMGVSSLRLGQTVTGSALAIGASVGYAWILADWLHLGLGLGVQYHEATLGKMSSPPSFGGVFPTVDINVGYAF